MDVSTSSNPSTQDSVSSEQKKRKRKESRVFGVLSPSARPYATLPVNTYEKFLSLFMDKMNSNAVESLFELKCHYLSKCKFVFRHYNRSDYSKPAPVNPIGVPNYIEMTGVNDYFSTVLRYMEALPDYTVTFTDMMIQKLQTKTILTAKCFQESTLVSRIPVPKSAKLDHVIEALALKAKDDVKIEPVAGEDMDTILELVSQVMRDTLYLISAFHLMTYILLGA